MSILSQQARFCSVFFMTKHIFYHNRSMLRDKSFVAASILLSRQKTCCVETNTCCYKTFIATTKIFAAALPMISLWLDIQPTRGLPPQQLRQGKAGALLSDSGTFCSQTSKPGNHRILRWGGGGGVGVGVGGLSHSLVLESVNL